MQIFPLIDPYAIHDDDFSSNGMMSRTGDGSYSIVTDSSANWNIAYGWGNHSDVGYAVSGGAEHDGFSDFVADEHINWTGAIDKIFSVTGPDQATDGTDALDVLTIIGGQGGDSGVGYTAGKGSDINLAGGQGGTATGGGHDKAAGGDLTFLGGKGGQGWNEIIAGNGGDVVHQGGQGGDGDLASTTPNGNGGDVFLICGEKGTGSGVADGKYGRIVFKRGGVESIFFNRDNNGHLIIPGDTRMGSSDAPTCELDVDGDGKFSGILTAPTIKNAGDVSINPDTAAAGGNQGNVVLFGGEDIPNNEAGAQLQIKRNASGGDRAIRLYIDQWQQTIMEVFGHSFIRNTSGEMDIDAQVDNLNLQARAGGNLQTFNDSANGENRLSYIYGYPTDLSKKYGSFQVVNIGGSPYFQLGTDSSGISISAESLGFFDATPVAKPTGVAESAAGIHAALVSLGLIAA